MDVVGEGPGSGDVLVNGSEPSQVMTPYSLSPPREPYLHLPERRVPDTCFHPPTGGC